VTKLSVSGVFEAVGRIPNTHLFQKAISLSQKGYILTDPDTMETSVSGIFACGDVQEQTYRQAVIAAASGCRAALSAKNYLLNQK
ncbi:MAG: FAD-dependent oxidoreductase, partial [Pseudomonadota bacterium]|nr:FAD-dependent oxidoreductase [Pseudomonadota bacterium]